MAEELKPHTMAENAGINTHRAHGFQAADSNGFDSKTASDKNGLLQTSTNIFVKANGNMVGMIQSFTISENRNINKLQSIGYEGVIQAVPSNTNGGQLSVTRIALYGANLYKALGLTVTAETSNPVGSHVHNSGSDLTSYTDDAVTSTIATGSVFRTLKDQRVPLEIEVKTPISATDFMTDVYIDCWLASFSKSYTVGQITVAENATIQYADVQ